MTTTPIVDIQLITEPAIYVPPPVIARAGGEAVFLGRTREESHEQFGKLLALHYDAYQSMAISRLNALAQRTITENQCLYVCIHHTLGRVAIGEASVFIQTLAPHRGQAFEACRFLIDELKNDVPIWKQEVWESRDKTWVHPE